MISNGVVVVSQLFEPSRLAAIQESGLFEVFEVMVIGQDFDRDLCVF
jgi:hypothetical protein